MKLSELIEKLNDQLLINGNNSVVARHFEFDYLINIDEIGFDKDKGLTVIFCED